MSTLLDTLLIKIDGDARGIQSVIKQAVSSSVGAVNEINKQEVDWTSIFTRAVSPAIIAGIASTFAFAIDQSLQFQQAMNQTGTAAGDSTAQIAQLSQQALGLSTVVPASAQDIATAMTQVGTVFGQNSAATNDLVQQMAELSASGFGPLSDIVSSSLELFKQFGATTETSATQVLTDLMHAAQGADESIPSLTSQFASFANQLPAADKSVSSFNNLIATFASEVVNLGSAGAAQIFQAIGTASNFSNPALTSLAGGMSSITKSLLSDGGLSAIETLTTKLQAMGPNAALVASGFGLSAEQVAQFQTNASKLPDVAKDAKNIADNTQTIQQAYDGAKGSLTELDLLWNHFKADAINVGSIFLPVVGMWAQSLNQMLTASDTFFTQVKGGWDTVISDFTSNGWTGAFQDILTGVGTTLANTFKNPLASLTNPASAGLNEALQGSGVGFDQGTLGRIDQSASSSGLIDSLVNALSTGIKQGQYAQLTNTFNLTVPAGSTGLTAKQIAAQLYQQFQGT